MVFSGIRLDAGESFVSSRDFDKYGVPQLVKVDKLKNKIKSGKYSYGLGDFAVKK